MNDGIADLPDDVDALKAPLIASRAEVARVEAEAAAARVQLAEHHALIIALKLQIEKYNGERYGPRQGAAPPAAVFTTRAIAAGEHPQRHLARWAGILQADAYGGYDGLYDPGRSPGPIHQALCWAHGRRKLFELADIAEAARAEEPAARPPSSRRLPSRR